MDDLISKKAAIEAFDRIQLSRIKGLGLELLISVSDAKDMLEGMKAVDAAPVKHGRWIGKRYNFKTYEIETVPCVPMSFEDIGELICSVCGSPSLLNGHEEDVPSNYCPNCGAKMDLEE